MNHNIVYDIVFVIAYDIAAWHEQLWAVGVLDDRHVGFLFALHRNCNWILGSAHRLTRQPSTLALVCRLFAHAT